MIELPECVAIAKQAKELLLGKTIDRVEVLKTPHKFAFFKEDIQSFPDLLEGQTLTDASSHGGFLEFSTEDASLLFSDGASLRYYEAGAKFPLKHQFALYFDDGSALFMSVRMYAILIVCKKGTCTDGYYLTSKKPTPLDDTFTFPYFLSLIDKEKKQTLKALLATHQRIPGLGNGVLQDILWDAGFDPRFPVDKLSESDLKQIYDSICKIIKQMCDKGGRNVETNLLGQKGGYICQLCSQALFEPCTKCGGPLEKAAYMGGTIYFCAHCQRRE